MDWAKLLLGVAVLVGFALVKIIAELVWEGLKSRLRRELGSDPAPVPTGGAELAEHPARPDGERE